MKKKNTFKTDGNIASLDITGGRVKVDVEDLDKLLKHAWFVSKNRYAIARIDNHFVRMHRLITGWDIDEARDIDHIDGDGLNNCRSNLRAATRSQNQANRGVQRNSTSGYIGVTWNKNHKKWEAKINQNKIRHHIGFYSSIIEAAKAYDSRKHLLFGDFAYTNFSGGA